MQWFFWTEHLCASPNVATKVFGWDEHLAQSQDVANLVCLGRKPLPSGSGDSWVSLLFAHRSTFAYPAGVSRLSFKETISPVTYTDINNNFNMNVRVYT